MSGTLRACLDLPGRDRALRAALERLARGGGEPLSLAGLTPSAAATLLPALLPLAPDGKILLLVPGEREAEQFRADLAFTTRVLRDAAAVHLLPSLEADPYQEMAPHLMTACERVRALRALRGPGEAIVVVPIRALIYPLGPPAAFDGYRLDLREEMTLRPDDLSGFLLRAGYVRVDLVSSMGEFSRRGGIIDYFPPGGDEPEGARPIRVEFWGEQIDSLRAFDPATQRSAARLGATTIVPVREYPWDREALERLRHDLEARLAARRARGAAALLAGEDGLVERIEMLATRGDFPGFEACVRLVEPQAATAFDYAPGALAVVWEESHVLAELDRVYVELLASFDLSEDFGMPPPGELLLPRDAVEPGARATRLRLSELAVVEADAPAPARVRCAVPRSYRGRLHELTADLKALPTGTTTLFLMDTVGRVERLEEVLREYDLPPHRLPGEEEAEAGAGPERVAPAGAAAPALLLASGRLSQGFALADAGLLVLTEREVFGEHAERDTRRRKVAAFSADFRDLKVGDLVVHVEHGIGRYAGIVRVGEDGSSRDFMLLTYEGADKLYVPIDRLDLVQRYSGIANKKARLDRLGGTGWEKTRRKVRKAMQEMAQDLLQLYAARRAARGHAFPEDTPWQKEFEDAFPYEVTADQVRAIRAVKSDMEGEVPMDRLICGDVGFGKTEVAMRAAFKAVMDGKQVAILCPTTVLAFQHLNTFRERFSSWPTSIEMISRFRSPREQKAILGALAEGKIDLLIGTHRLLSKDVKFRDLGLLVVDEEQRFGVAHKEAIKAIKKDVHVLTLTATPIPRTLQMSLAGIRDMSVIETPPENRLSIQTAIVPFREGVIAAAIRNELNRGGQVYLVHNRVESIASMGNLIGKLVPEARLAIGHGQLNEAALERTMLDFLKGEFDVLLATTIIENGLDIPRVNTIIVNRADRFGLAQLYQLRGRVGRSDRRAYAYLLVPARKALTTIARQRLKALQEFSDLGSGFRIAAMDLEIRGAGNMLGAEQSGHIAAVGFEMYCQLLERTVRELKGEPPAPEQRAQINLGIDIKIPETVIPDFSDRLVLYKKISSAADDEELARIGEQIKDLYGEVPRQAGNLLALASLRLLADRLNIRSIDLASGRVQIRFGESVPVPPEDLVALATRRPGLSLTPAGLLRLDLSAMAATPDQARIASIRGVLQGLTTRGSMQLTSAGPSAAELSNGDR